MSGYVIKIPQEKENRTIWSRQLRVAAYCRVSTPYEEQQKSLEKQIEYFTQYIKRNPFWRFVAVYADNASGLHAKNRPGYQKMLKDCRKRQYQVRFAPTDEKRKGYVEPFAIPWLHERTRRCIAGGPGGGGDRTEDI